MPLPITFDSIVNGLVVEHERVEFKETWDAQASVKTICAFANDLNNWGGGYLVLGVRDAGDAKDFIGIPPEKADAWQKDILNKCKLIQPDYMPVSEVCQREGKLFMVLWCPGGSTRPYSSPKSMGKKSERVSWIRHLSSTVAPSAEELRELYTLANNVPFDDRPHHAATIDDMSLPLIKEYLRAVGSSLYDQADSLSFADLCLAMRIAAGPAECIRPLNVGLLFFSMEPDKFFPYAQVDIVEFPDGEGGNRLIEHTFKGPLDRQMKDAMQYLSNTVVARETVKDQNGNPSKQHFNYPVVALREALANAIYHKGYDTREPIEVRVLPDRIEVLSHPGADRSISIEGLKHYRLASRRYRNRRIGEFLKELGLTEGRNTGVHKILQSLRENGSPEPLFETDEDRLYFMVTIYARKDMGGFDGIREIRADGPTLLKERRAQVRQYFEAHPGATVKQASDDLSIPRATLNRDLAFLRDTVGFSRG